MNKDLKVVFVDNPDWVEPPKLTLEQAQRQKAVTTAVRQRLDQYYCETMFGSFKPKKNVSKRNKKTG